MKFASGEIYLFESLGKTGVAFYRWNDFMRYHWNLDYEQMLYRKLNCVRPREMIEKLEKFVLTILGKKHTMSICKLCKCTNVKENPEKKKGYFCSELVASVYKQMGVLADTKLSSRFYPGTFESINDGNLEFTNDANLGPEILIDFYL